MGANINAIANLTTNSTHIYKEFIQAHSPQVIFNNTQKFKTFTDGYYDRLGNDTVSKHRMLTAYIRSVKYELSFMESTYHLIPVSSSENAPKFTDFVETWITPQSQKDVVHHKLYSEIGAGSLNFDDYAVLLQQDQLYLEGFYKAYAALERKERDPERKGNLTKNPERYYAFFLKQYEKYGFGKGEVIESYTQGKA
jgi:thiaminase